MKDDHLHAKADEWLRYTHEFFMKHKLDNGQITSLVGGSLIMYLLRSGFSEKDLKYFIQGLLETCVATKRKRKENI